MLGIALAMNLAYLNLPIFSFLSLISDAVGSKIDALPDSTKRHVESTPWFKDAVEISKVKNLERMEFHNRRSGPKWTPFKRIWCAVAFNILFKCRVGKIVSLCMTALTCELVILGVMIGIYPDHSSTRFLLDVTPSPFALALFAFFWPLFCIGMGAFIRVTVVSELNYNLSGLGEQAMQDMADALAKAEDAAA